MGNQRNKRTPSTEKELTQAFKEANIVDHLCQKQLELEKKEKELEKREAELESSEKEYEEDLQKLHEDQAYHEQKKEDDLRLAYQYDVVKKGQVTLNVGGRKFETSRETLSFASGYFQSMFSGAWDIENDKEIFIDQDPDIFDMLLRYMRTGHNNEKFKRMCKDMDVADALVLMGQLEYFQLDSLLNAFKTKTFDLSLEDLQKGSEVYLPAFYLMGYRMGGRLHRYGHNNQQLQLELSIFHSSSDTFDMEFTTEILAHVDGKSNLQSNHNMTGTETGGSYDTEKVGCNGYYWDINEYSYDELVNQENGHVKNKQFQLKFTIQSIEYSL